MLLGLAIGDSLGNTSEGRSGWERKKYLGEVRDYQPNGLVGNRPVGLPSDDTQLTFWTIESLLRNGALDPDDLARTFARSRIFGIGKTVREAIGNIQDGAPWWRCGVRSAGNGALMRIAPILLPHLRNPSPQLWEDTVAATIITHRDEMAVAVSTGFIGLLANCLAAEGPPLKLGWWIDSFLRYAKPMETGERYQSNVRLPEFSGTLCEFIEQNVSPALRTNMTVEQASDSWFSGAFLLQALPVVLFILEKHGHDPEEAIVRAVNDTWDNDTIGAIVGAAVGALHGKEKLPERWISGLLGRTRENDDGHVFDVIEQAVRKFVD